MSFGNDELLLHDAGTGRACGVVRGLRVGLTFVCASPLVSRDVIGMPQYDRGWHVYNAVDGARAIGSFNELSDALRLADEVMLRLSETEIVTGTVPAHVYVWLERMYHSGKFEPYPCSAG